MFKIIIYNIICEIGLAVLFDNISKNVNIKSIKCGAFYKKITVRLDNSPNPDALSQAYYDCTITQVYNGKYAGQPVTLFNFTDRTGDVIMACDQYTSDFL